MWRNATRLNNESTLRPPPLPPSIYEDVLTRSYLLCLSNHFLFLDVTSTASVGVTNQEFINRPALGHRPGPGEHDPRNDVLTAQSARRISNIASTTPSAWIAGSIFSRFALQTTGVHGASTASVYFLFAKQLRDSGLPAGVLAAFALRRGTTAQVTTHALDGFTCPACRRGRA